MTDGPGENKKNVAEMKESFDYSSQLLAQLAQLRNDSLLCDVTLLVQGTWINAHRIVLAACSDYFKGMFTNDMAEKHMREIEIVDVEASTLYALVNFCYSGRIMITNDNSLSILAAACRFQLGKVQGLCCEFLKENLGLSNCLEIFATSDVLSCQELFLCAEMYIVQNFQKVAESENFNQLSFDQLFKLISREELSVQSEEQVFAAVTRWVRFEQATRQKFLPKLLEHVRLASCHPKFLVGTVSEDPLVMNDAACRRLLDKAKNSQLLRLSTDGPLGMQGTRFRNPKLPESGEVLYVVGGLLKKSGCTVERLDPAKAEAVWEYAAPMTTSRNRVGVAVLDNLLYAVCGQNEDTTSLSSVERFDPVKNQWSSDVAQMSTPRHEHGVAALNGFLYAVGGWNFGSLDSVERYDAERNQWTTVASMKTPRCGLSVFVLDGCLYAAGGSNNGHLRIVERLDPRAGKWENVCAMLEARYYFGTAVLDGHLYAAGGMGASMTVEKYNPLTNKWIEVPAMTTDIDIRRLAVVNGKLYALDLDCGRVEVFDSEMNKWKHHSRINEKRYGADVGVLRLP